MTDYIRGLDRATYMFSKDGRMFSPKNDESRKSITAFLDIVNKSENLDCIVEEITRGTVLSVKATNIETFGTAVLSINYGGLHGYHAKIMLGNGEQVAVQGGSDTAVRRIVNYLKTPKAAEKTTTSRRIPIVNTELVTAEPHPHDKYADLEQEFEE